METPEKAKQQSTQPKLNFHVMPTLSTDQKWAVYFACKGWAFRAASDPNTEVLREELMPNCPGRKQLSRHLTQAASILRTACLKQLKGPITLCYDSGTIAGSRYLLFVASTPSGACVVRCIRDSQLPGGKLTSVNIKSSIDEVTNIIKKFGVVVTLVADNASNMQSADTGGIQRCAAHLLQLAMKDCSRIGAVAEGLEILEELDEDSKKCLPSIPPTRWSYVILQLEALADILRTAGSDVEMRHKVETAAELLKPFRVATDRVQRADATLFSCLSTWEALLGSLDDRLRQVIISRFSSMLRGPYLIAAFFSPVVNSLAYARVLDPVVVEQLEAISPAAAAEYQEYRRHPRTPPVTQCTLASYLLHVENTLDQKWPALAVAVRCCVLSTPTEAAVERGFSHMKFIINDRRNKVASNTAENLVVAQSCFKKHSTWCGTALNIWRACGRTSDRPRNS
jgi:hypothetical protein